MDQPQRDHWDWTVAQRSYRYVRASLIGLFVALATAVVFQSITQGGLLTSISAYYYTPAQAIFVGALVAIGAAMVALRGVTTMEEVALNIGGMLAPAAIYLAFNAGGPGRAGWGVPMATDIAFAVGVLALVRSRVSNALAVFLTALAIFDDIGGILVIAVFYGAGVSLGWIAAAAAITAALGALNRWHVRSGIAWACGGAVLWYAFHRAGIHPRTTASGIQPAQVRRLHGAMRQILRKAIDCRGSSVSDYRDSSNRPGTFQRHHRVYRRAGEPCPTCREPIEYIRVGGRGTHLCPSCQRDPKASGTASRRG